MMPQQDWCRINMIAFTAVFITSHYATDAVIRRYICGLVNDAAQIIAESSHATERIQVQLPACNNRRKSPHAFRSARRPR